MKLLRRILCRILMGAGALSLAVAALAAATEELPSAAELVRQMQDADWKVRRQSTPKIFKLSQSGPEAQAAILHEIKAAEALFRRAAIERKSTEGEALVLTLGQVRGEPEVTIPILQEGLKNPDWLVRRATAFALERYGADASAAVPDLKAILARSESPNVVWAMAQALAKIDPDSAATSVAALRGVLRDTTGEARYARAHAAIALTRVGPAALAAVPELILLLDDAEPDARQNALGALLELKAPPAVPVMIRMLDTEPNPLGLIDGLGRIGPQAREALPVLEAFVRAGEEPVRTVAYSAIARIDPSHREAVSELVRSLEEGAPSLRVMAAAAAAGLASRESAIRDAIERLLKVSSPELRVEAAMTLAHAGIFQDQVRLILEEAMTDSDPRRKAAISRALEGMKNP